MRWLPVVLALASASVACNRVPEPDASPAPARTPPVKDEFTITDTVVGKGAEAKDGSAVKVHYTGKLKNGTEFDSSVGKAPFDVTIGKGQVIKGWDKGLVGMKVGGKRTLLIPSDLGYGETGSPPKIPPRATLVFDIELLEVK